MFESRAFCCINKIIHNRVPAVPRGGKKHTHSKAHRQREHTPDTTKQRHKQGHTRQGSNNANGTHDTCDVRRRAPTHVTDRTGARPVQQASVCRLHETHSEKGSACSVRGAVDASNRSAVLRGIVQRGASAPSARGAASPSKRTVSDASYSLLACLPDGDVLSASLSGRRCLGTSSSSRSSRISERCSASLAGCICRVSSRPSAPACSPLQRMYRPQRMMRMPTE